MRDLHSALKTTVLQDFQEGGIHYKQVRLQAGKSDFVDTIHARPSSWTMSGLQSTDLLHFLGFRRSPCAFHMGECYVRAVHSDLDIRALTESIGITYKQMEEGARHLEKCGLFIDQPEGWGFFYRKPSSGRRYSAPHVFGNGHVAPKSERMKEAEDEFFRFIFTWIEGAEDKGWTTHYRAKHMPLSPEFEAALKFLGGFSTFPECPEFEFESCWWRFTPFKENADDFFGGNAEYVHRCFDAHLSHFSPGLSKLLAAHAEVQKHGLSFLSIAEEPRESLQKSKTEKVDLPSEVRSEQEFLYDVAISFARTEREYAEQLANIIKGASFNVFYDNFYPEQLWGKDLVAFFDSVYRKDSRFCVMFISAQYAERIWTTHERRSAQARALKERGREYILPIRIDDTDLEGLPPTVGYLSLDNYTIKDIASILIKKLQTF